MLQLKIGSSQREVEIPLNKLISLGRIDPTANIFSEVDLSSEGELARNISISFPSSRAAWERDGGGYLSHDPKFRSTRFWLQMNDHTHFIAPRLN
jgi:hypothetical protein